MLNKLKYYLIAFLLIIPLSFVSCQTPPTDPFALNVNLYYQLKLNPTVQAECPWATSEITGAVINNDGFLISGFFYSENQNGDFWFAVQNEKTTIIMTRVPWDYNYRATVEILIVFVGINDQESSYETLKLTYCMKNNIE